MRLNTIAVVHSTQSDSALSSALYVPRGSIYTTIMEVGPNKWTLLRSGGDGRRRASSQGMAFKTTLTLKSDMPILDNPQKGSDRPGN